jgi:hypothetical protein
VLPTITISVVKIRFITSKLKCVENKPAEHNNWEKKNERITAAKYNFLMGIAR